MWPGRGFAGAKAGDIEEYIEEGFKRWERDEGYAGKVLCDSAYRGLGERPGVIKGEDSFQSDGLGDGTTRCQGTKTDKTTQC